MNTTTIGLGKYTNDASPPYRCKVAGCEAGAFQTAQGIRMHHIRMHSDKRWDTTRNLKRGSPNRRNGFAVDAECPVCHSDFATRATMTAHLRARHGKSIRDFQPARHECPYCDFVAGSTRAGLVKHINCKHPGATGLVEMRPTKPAAAIQSIPQESAIHFCPQCGEDIQKWRKI